MAFHAKLPRSGKNQCAKSIAPCSRAHAKMVSAMIFWSSCALPSSPLPRLKPSLPSSHKCLAGQSSGVGAPEMRHSLKRVTTAAGSFAAIAPSSNMQVPKVVSASDMAPASTLLLPPLQDFETDWLPLSQEFPSSPDGGSFRKAADIPVRHSRHVLLSNSSGIGGIWRRVPLRHVSKRSKHRNFKKKKPLSLLQRRKRER